MTTNFQNMITVGTPAKWTPAIGALVDALVDIVDVLDSDDEITVPA